jgi:hypothetical protein
MDTAKEKLYFPSRSVNLYDVNYRITTKGFGLVLINFIIISLDNY